MKLLNAKNAVIAALIVAALVAGYALGHRGAAPVADTAESTESTESTDSTASSDASSPSGNAFWTCPMHPEIVQDGPGDCPICGMDLVEKSPGEPLGEAEIEGLVTVKLDERDQQLIGVTTEVLKARNLKRDIRTYGNVEADETSLHTVNAKVGGWIEELYVDFTGKSVSAGQALLSIYSPELVQTQEEYLLALRAQEKLGSSRFSEVSGSGDQLVRAAKRRLELWDISADQIRRLERTGQSTKTLVLHAPTDGIVMERHAIEGMKVTPGMPLFKLADLSRVWVQASLYDADLPLVELGMEADISIEGLPGRKFGGSVEFIEPTMGDRTRSARARIVVDNADGSIKPSMYATVKIRVPLGEVIALPREAILDT
ncbi:MAG TPA: efflux RND transporter periplasmic adaptor subunit, partial [Armatimonadota bacterium]|nr:efflux RND transporter periplasmic adaptor subunit [Armatimonadota bacterium]